MAEDALPGIALPLAARATNAPSISSAQEVRHAAEQFEAMFLAEMLAPVFEGLDTEGLGGGGLGERVFRPMLIEQYANAIASSGGVGLADSIVRELNRMQGEPDAPPEAHHGADR